MKHLKLYFFLLTLLALCVSIESCIEKIDLQSEGRDDILVVEGGINNLEGPYEVLLSYATNELGNEAEFQKPIPVIGANVSINDLTTGQVFVCFPGPDLGQYLTEEKIVVGEIGHSYSLEIKIGQRTYVSEPEEILEPIPVDELNLNYNFDTDLVELQIDFNDILNDDNYYRWTWEGFREALTLTAPVEEVVCDPPIVDCCGRCFIPLHGEEVFILSDQFTDGSSYRDKTVGAFPVLRPNGYLIELQQHTISRKAYEFWRLIELQKESQGGLFDPPPFQVNGNIKSVERPNEMVLGFFNVSGIHAEIIQFDGGPFTLNQYPYDRVCDDCRWIPLADTTKPDNWIDEF